jgi:hypothetical protein
MTSYEEAEKRLEKSPLLFSNFYEKFIIGYCDAVGVGSYGYAVAKSIQAAKDEARMEITGVSLVSILCGVILKMDEIGDPKEDVLLSSKIAVYLLAYLISDSPTRSLAIILFNHMLSKRLYINTPTIEEIQNDLIDVSSMNASDLVVKLSNKFKNLPFGSGAGERLSERQAFVAFGALYKTWDRFMQLGQTGINQLIQMTNSNNTSLAITASAILAVWDTPEHHQIEAIYSSQPFVKFNSPGDKDVTTKIIGNLSMKTVALSGNMDAQVWIKNLCAQKGMNLHDWMNSIVHSSICIVRDS